MKEKKNKKIYIFILYVLCTLLLYCTTYVCLICYFVSLMIDFGISKRRCC